MQKIISYIFIILVVVMFIFPYYWMVTTSLQNSTGFYRAKNIIPKSITFEHYVNLFRLKLFTRWNFNSMFVSLSTVFLTCLFCTMAGYIFAKKDIPGKNILFWGLLITMAIPSQILLIPLFILMRDLHMINTYQGLILPALARPFGIFLMRLIFLT